MRQSSVLAHGSPTAPASAAVAGTQVCSQAKHAWSVAQSAPVAQPGTQIARVLSQIWPWGHVALPGTQASWQADGPSGWVTHTAPPSHASSAHGS